MKVGPYIIERRIGLGGMAEVFLAKKPLGRTFKNVVVKRILPEFAGDERFVEMFLREAGILAQLNHTNVVQIFDLGTADDQLYIALEYLDGLSVHDLAVTSWRARRPLPIELVLRVLLEAARGLDYVHRQPGALIHRDVAPDNIFFVRDGTIKLMDFGIARTSRNAPMTSKGELKGKIPFMSPEQLDGRDLDARTDLWSLGISAYWLLAGRRPFRSDTDLGVMRSILRTDPPRLSSLCVDVPPWLDALVMQLLEKDRERRVPDAGVVERAVNDHAGARLDRTRDVAFVDTLCAIPVDELDAEGSPLPAAQRGAIDPFARVTVPVRASADAPTTLADPALQKLSTVSAIEVEASRTGDVEVIDEVEFEEFDEEHVVLSVTTARKPAPASSGSSLPVVRGELVDAPPPSDRAPRTEETPLATSPQKRSDELPRTDETPLAGNRRRERTTSTTKRRT